MDLEFDLGTLIPSGAQPPISKLENQKLMWARKLRQQPQSLALERTIDRLGKLSAEAQSLKHPVTTFDRFVDSSDEQALYLLWELKTTENMIGEEKGERSATSGLGHPTSILLGYLKIVRNRRLYLVDEHGRRYIHTPLCVLDIFVHDSVRHQGRALELFNAMLKSEQTEAAKCAYDRPSPSFLQFLSRHYGLEQPNWQPTSLVVFASFFEGLQPEDAEKNGEEEKRPMTALERNRKSINERYNGTAPLRATAGHSPHDGAGALIHGTGQMPNPNSAGPDTPKGRKVTRDYGHQRIW